MNENTEILKKVLSKTKEEVAKVIIGYEHVVDQALVAIFTGTHALVEGVPGIAKTLLVRTLAHVMRCDFARIQFTPDLMPTDITGTHVFNLQTNEFSLVKGPVFCSFLLADEINRAPAKTQSALLQAMQERTVTIDRETHRLPPNFTVFATQNPIEYEGTFPLPEAQVDRFIMKLSLGYPSVEEEHEILRRRRERKRDAFDLHAITDAGGLQNMRQEVEDVHLDEDIERYIVELTSRTRSHKQVAVGSSPRGTLALLKLTRAWAAMHDRTFVLPDDVKRFVLPALSHRLILEPDLWTVRRAADDVIQDIVQSVPVPVIKEIT